MDTLVIERIDENAPHGLGVAEIVQHFIDEQLPLAVGVAAVHDLIGARDQPLHHGELLRRALIHNELPLLRQDRQILCAPAFQRRIVLLRLRLTQHMPKKPRHHTAARLDPSRTLAVRRRKTRGKRAADTRLLRDVEPHENTLMSAQMKMTIHSTIRMDAPMSSHLP